MHVFIKKATDSLKMKKLASFTKFSFYFDLFSYMRKLNQFKQYSEFSFVHAPISASLLALVCEVVRKKFP